MGVIKKLLSPFFKDADIAIKQAKAIIKADKISRGEKILPPKHPTDEKHFQQAQLNTALKEKVDRHDERLVTNVQQISIKSFDPPAPSSSSRLLPTHDSEYESSKHDRRYEYGFYEPPLDKMQKGRIMFKEAMELLHAKTELELGGSEAENASKTLSKHPSKSRITSADLDQVYEYFRPFVERKKQMIISQRDVNLLSDYMNNRVKLLDNIDWDAELAKIRETLKKTPLLYDERNEPPKIG